MKNKKTLNFFFVIITIIIGRALFKQFNFENLTFRHTGLAIIYIITLIFSTYIIIKSYSNKPEK